MSDSLHQVLIGLKMAVSGSDVYIPGMQSKLGGYQAAYWKNNSVHLLTDGTKQSRAASIALSGNDIYVAGAEDDVNGWAVPKYWKNGTPHTLTTSSGDAYDICVIAK